jgi:hypothetical protein
MVRKNPLNLNPLQLRTLTLFQALSELEGIGFPTKNGDTFIAELPRPHGNHFHLGPWVVLSRDATGLNNPAPWLVLQRKGLIESEFPVQLVLKQAGKDYDTGLRDEILHSSDH